MSTAGNTDVLWQRALALDAADPLAEYRDHFIGTDTGLSYLDGNSLGRPLRRAALAAVTDRPGPKSCWTSKISPPTATLS